MPASLTLYRKANPVYTELSGWSELIDEVWELGYESLPGALKRYISFIEKNVGCPVKIVSVGPQRHETLIR